MKKSAGFIITACILNCLLQISCRKAEWFDVKSNKKLTVPSTLQDFEYLLDDFVVMNQETPGLAEVGSDGHFMPDKTTVVPAERNAYTWTNSLPNIGIVDWNRSYKRIFQCNLVLAGLEKILPANSKEQESYNMIKGNALFHRAKNYYDLAQIYAQPYKASSASSDLGIPLRDGIDITEPAKRASVEETYKQIIDDLQKTLKLLPPISQLPSRGSKAAAFALIARAYLAMEHYENAGAYADSSLRLYNKLLNFNTVSSTAPNLGQFNIETIFYAQRTTTWQSTWRSGVAFVDKALYDLYNSNDLRKSRFFTVSGSNIIFKGNYNNTAAGFDGLATDEQYLIKAESYARLGNVIDAMKTLNDFLRTRWNNAVAYTELSAANAEEALIKILIERRKELLFRNIRWTDLRRLNLDSRFKVTITRTFGGQTYTLEPDSYKYTLPIPDDIIGFSGIAQNPGWQK